jgi:histidine phosphotransferase ChpT
LDLTALVGSRICHDLISPLGAIGNGVELLAMSGGQFGAELSLISRSVDNANARIKLFRVAFGAAEAGQMMATGEVAGILKAISEAGKVAFSLAATGDIPRQEAKLIFLSVQCLETALPYGGEVRIDREASAWNITAQADRLRDEPALWDIATGAVAANDLSASMVHFALIAQEIERQDRKLACDLGEDQIRLTF